MRARPTSSGRRQVSKQSDVHASAEKQSLVTKSLPPPRPGAQPGKQNGAAGFFGDTVRKLTPQELAIEAVNMFLEYRDVHGEEDEEIAKIKASHEMEGYAILLDPEIEELHRLREVNAQLLAACEAANKWDGQQFMWPAVGAQIRNAIAAARGK